VIEACVDVRLVDGLAGLCGERDNYLIRARRNLHRLNFRVLGLDRDLDVRSVALYRVRHGAASCHVGGRV
jgi:hypothetical protein